MKRLFLLIAQMLIIVACSQDLPQADLFGISEFTNFSNAPKTKSSQDVDYEVYEIIKAGYIDFIDNQYGIRISVEEASELGYSIEGYNYLENQLMIANEQILQDIEKWENDPEVKEWHIIDCTYGNVDDMDSTLELISIKTRQEQTVTMPGGTISATLGTPGECSTFAPNGMKGVSGDCYAHVALGAVSKVVTNFFGGIHSASRVGNGKLSVPIAASNTYGRIQFITSDSNGGIFSWNGYM